MRRHFVLLLYFIFGLYFWIFEFLEYIIRALRARL
jgi:hypothetical protein